ncbi:hypothetical protein T07_6360 [Trichinella nelsoni]|uniref:Uncharacterized protein n=1 Tax=Trichinella nelsoni TaxID=6336 RepID=A0A0V0SEZ0_9BILA|nr:hypothetical protein T07_6360 [Trichinella nelsoni]
MECRHKEKNPGVMLQLSFTTIGLQISQNKQAMKISSGHERTLVIEIFMPRIDLLFYPTGYLVVLISSLTFGLNARLSIRLSVCAFAQGVL